MTDKEQIDRLTETVAKQAEDIVALHASVADLRVRNDAIVRTCKATFTQMQTDVHQLARSKGWYDGEKANRNIGEMLALIHSEISEALEAWRVTGTKDDVSDVGKPEGFGVELADAVIRIMDLAEYTGTDLWFLILAKHEYNKTRPYRHGGKAA